MRAVKSSLRRDLVLFAILTVVITVGLWLVLVASGLSIKEGAGFWIFGVLTSGPSLSALILFLVRRGPRQRVSAPWLWLPAALVLGAAPTIIANLLVAPGAVAVGVDQIPATLAQFGGGLMFVVLYLIAGPLAEEFGWRGYVQPRLRQRLGLISTSVVLGLAWALWHVPLFFLPGTGQHAMGLFTPNGLIFVLTCIPLSFLYLFVSERLGGRVWAAILIHFSGNAIGAFLPSESWTTSLVILSVNVALAAGAFAVWGRERHSTSRGLSR